MSDTEYETKVLGINPVQIIKKLIELGAIETPEILMRRYVFDMESEGAEWIRLRDGGGKTTMAYKHKQKGNTEVGKTTEIEVEVLDFDKTTQILKKIPFAKIFYQENKTHRFKLNEIEFSIDTWPMLEPYLEIESSNKEKVEEGLRILDLVGQDIGDKDVMEIYDDVGIELNSYSDLRF